MYNIYCILIVPISNQLFLQYFTNRNNKCSNKIKSADNYARKLFTELCILNKCVVIIAMRHASNVH